MTEWFESYEEWFTLLGVISLIAFIGSLIIVPMIVLNLPADYFTRSSKKDKQIAVGRAVLHLLKNIVGLFFVVIGLLMLVLPGQGILTLLLGFSMIDFPLKRRIQVSILQAPRVQNTVNWIRAKGERQPLQIPQALDQPKKRS